MEPDSTMTLHEAYGDDFKDGLERARSFMNEHGEAVQGLLRDGIVRCFLIQSFKDEGEFWGIDTGFNITQGDLRVNISIAITKADKNGKD